MMENIEYRCTADCIHNGAYDTRAFRPCHLKNKDLKRNKDTIRCYGNKCGFYEKNTKEDPK